MRARPPHLCASNQQASTLLESLSSSTHEQHPWMETSERPGVGPSEATPGREQCTADGSGGDTDRGETSSRPAALR
ncbi:hypothetical protein ElyMa_004118600 [Elysia marginata]|uniref:Uncharacterized protein n=1 Tax=Elysia marginata TaxID=1093978 RepID=A0AAV4GDR6_9GAST|nr:hypothetical protein ElyMa_004118600 [Elysia marginata]